MKKELNNFSLGDASHARSIYLNRARLMERRLPMMALIQQRLNGEPPEDQADLDAQGRGHEPNFCDGEFESSFRAWIDPRFDFIRNGKTYIKLESGYGDEPQRTRALELFAREHKKMFDGWKAWDAVLWSALRNGIYGSGCLLWPDSRGKEVGGWQPKSVSYADLLPAETDTIDVDTWDVFFVRGKWRVSELLEFISDSEMASEAGWDVEAVKSICWAHLEGALSSQTGRAWTYADPWVDFIFQDTMFWGYAEHVHPVSLITVYTKEKDGSGIRKSLMPVRDIATGSSSVSYQYMSPVTGKASDRNVGYLFQSPDSQLYANNSDVICLLPDNYGEDGYYYTVRGWGVRNLPQLDAKLRMRLAMLNSAMMAGGLIIQPETERDANKLEQVQFNMGGLTVLQPGLKVQSSGLSNPGNAYAAIYNEFEAIQRKTSTQFSPESAASATDTVYGQKVLLAEGNKLSQASANRDNTAMTTFHQTCVRRMLNCNLLESYWQGEKVKCNEEAESVLCMLSACEKQGFDFEYLYKKKTAKKVLDLVEKWQKYEDKEDEYDENYVITVRFNPAAGNGSPSQRIAELTNLQAIMPAASPAGKQAYYADYCESLGPQGSGERYFGMGPLATTEADNIASLENTMLTAGQYTPPQPGDNPEIHLEFHTAAAAAIAKQFQDADADPNSRNIDPHLIDVTVRGMAAMLQHVTTDDNAHLKAFGAGSRFTEQAYRQYQLAWNQFSNIYARAKQMLDAYNLAKQEQAQKDAQAPPPLSPSEQAKVAVEQKRADNLERETQAKINRDNFKAAEELKIKTKVNDADIQRNNTSHAYKMLQAAQDMQAKQAAATVDIGIKQSKLEQDSNKQNNNSK